MAELTYREAVAAGIAQEMARDERMVFLGEDVHRHAVDGVHKKSVVIEDPQGDSIAIRPVGVPAQIFDHRAIDGALADTSVSVRLSGGSI